jgi:hypothetical protein
LDRKLGRGPKAVLDVVGNTESRYPVENQTLELHLEVRYITDWATFKYRD